MQTLFIPDLIQIELIIHRVNFFTRYFRKSNGKAFKQDNILLCIKTIANHKNNVELSPFLSDKSGRVIITKKQLIKRKDLFISYGLMDYQSIESAKPDIEICLMGKLSLEKEITYLKTILQNKTDLALHKKLGNKIGKQVIKSAEIERQERENLHIFENCFNHNLKYENDVKLISDKWDNHSTIKNYKAVLSS